MIGFRIEMLTESFCATSAYDAAASEWPPHPARLFSALLSVAKKHWSDYTQKTGTEFLTWLQEQGNPGMRFSSSTNLSRTIYVPSNASLNDKSRKSGREWNEAYPASPILWYIWDVEIPNEFVNVANYLAEGLTRLGNSASLVVTSFHIDCPPVQYTPSADGPLAMRGISETQVQDLEEHYQSFPEYAGILPYEDVCYAPVAAPLSSQIFKDAIILEYKGGAQLDLLRAHQAAKQMRYLLMKCLGSPSSMISGHSEDGSPARHAHLAVIPLPYVGGRGDGVIKGFALCLPQTASSEDSLELLRAINVWQSRNGDAEDFYGDAPLTFGIGDEGDMTLQKQGEIFRRATDWKTWTQPSTRWSTVTPVTSVSYPKRKQSKEDVIRKMCLRAGLPDPINITAHEYSLWDGSPHDKSFRGMDFRIGNANPWMSHATVEFETPVSGPVIMGAGLHTGMGLFKPLF